MTQTRIFFTVANPRALELYGAIEREFEDDGLPLALVEIDEERDMHEISVYSSDTETDTARLRSLFSLQESFEIGLEEVPDIDWVAKSLEGLKPVRAGRILVHGSHDRAARRIGDIAIEIDAGQAFGTGHHGTTAGCLEMIGRVVRRERPRNALDLGTGSAVLAIALARIAPIPVLASDIDPLATAVARDNIRLNGVAGRVSAITATGFRHAAFSESGPFDLIVANVLAGPLIRLAPDMARHVSPGGSVILSGILERQRRAVIAAYSGQQFRHIATRRRGEWITMQLKR